MRKITKNDNREIDGISCKNFLYKLVQVVVQASQKLENFLFIFQMSSNEDIDYQQLQLQELKSDLSEVKSELADVL